MSIITSRKAIFFLGISAVVFLFLSVICTPVIDQILPADPLFFAANLSIFYWLSLASLLGLVLLRITTSLTARVKRLIDVFSIIVLVILVYGAPCFSYSQPVFVDNYIHTSGSLKLLLSEHMPPASSMMTASNTPGGYLILSSLLVTTNLEPLILMHYYPMLISFILLILLYVASLKFVGSDLAILTPFIFTAFRYGRMFHFYPGAFVYVFFILFMIFFYAILQQGGKKSLKLLVLLLVASSAITYTLGAPILFLISLLPFLAHLLKRVPKINLGKLAVKSSLILPALFFLVWLSWLLFLSQGQFRSLISIFQKMMIGDTSIVLPAAVSSSGFFSIRMFTLLIKNGSTIFLVLSGVLLVLLLFIDAKRKFERNQILLIGGSFLLFYSLTLLFLPITSDALTRFNGFAVIPYCLVVPLFISKVKNGAFGSKLRKYKLNKIIPLVLILAMLFLMFMVPIVRNDNDPGYYYPSSSLSGSDYASENLRGSVIYVKNHVHLIEFMASMRGNLLEGYMGLQENEDVRYISLSRWQSTNEKENNSILYFSKKAVENCDAMIFNDYEDAQLAMLGYFNYSQARLDFEEYVSYRLNQVYSSGTMRIYSRQGI